MARPKFPAWMLPLWQRALDVEIGIAFKVIGTTRETFRAQLFECRNQSRDPRLQDLITFCPAAPCGDEVWICKKMVELD